VPYKNIEDRRAADLRHYHRLIQRLHDLKGGECKECGRRDRALEIHHTAEDGKNKRRRKSRTKELRRLAQCPDEYDLLCSSPCHQRVTMRYVRSYGKGGKRER
jgi:hypothetical protein